MKSKLFLTGLAALAFAGFAQAQTTIIDITGATAFRSAAVAAINAAYQAGGNYRAAHTSTDVDGNATTQANGTMQIWSGSFPGIAGTTIIRTSWNGSVEGIRAVADVAGPSAEDPSFLQVAQLSGTPANPFTSVGVTWGSALVETSDAEMTFSDVAVSSTPVNAPSLVGGPMGVVVFTMIANKQWHDDAISANNITAQQFRALAGAGQLPLSVFTGSSADTNIVYLTGRNDGSGTRTTYLAETGYGISNPVVQYVVHDRSTPTITKILKTAAGGGFNFQDVATARYASTIWGLNIDGNGGYSSGGDVRVDLAKNSSSAAVWEFFDLDDSGTYTADEDFETVSAAKIYLVSWLSTSDARTARGTGLASAATAQILGYNGVILSGLAGDNPPSTLGANDKALVANGKYTAWGYENLFHLGTAATTTVFNDLKTRLNNASIIGSAGMPMSEMNVSRVTDGGVVQPGAL